MPTKLYPLTDTHPRRPLHHTAPQPSRARRRVRSHADTPLLRRACGEEGEAEKTAGNHGHPFVPEALEPIRTPRFVPSFSSALRPPPSSTHLRTPIPRDPPPNRPTTRQGTAKEAESCRHPSSPKSMRRRGGSRENRGESRTPICSGGIGTNPDFAVCPLSSPCVAATALQYPLTDTHPKGPSITPPHNPAGHGEGCGVMQTPLFSEEHAEKKGGAEKTAGNHGHPFVPDALEPIRTSRFVPSLSSRLRPPPSSTLLSNGRVMPGDPSLRGHPVFSRIPARLPRPFRSPGQYTIPEVRPGSATGHCLREREPLPRKNLRYRGPTSESRKRIRIPPAVLPLLRNIKNRDKDG